MTSLTHITNLIPPYEFSTGLPFASSQFPKLNSRYLPNWVKKSGHEISLDYLSHPEVNEDVILYDLNKYKEFIKKIFLSYCPIKEITIQTLLNCCPSIERLALDGCDDLKDNHMIELTKKCASIKELYLFGCKSLTPKGIHEIARLKQLHVLDVGNCNIDERSLKNILSHCPLTFLDISFCKLTDYMIRMIFEKDQLKFLNITDCTFTDSLSEEAKGYLFSFDLSQQASSEVEIDISFALPFDTTLEPMLIEDISEKDINEFLSQLGSGLVQT